MNIAVHSTSRRAFIFRLFKLHFFWKKKKKHVDQRHRLTLGNMKLFNGGGAMVILGGQQFSVIRNDFLKNRVDNRKKQESMI